MIELAKALVKAQAEMGAVAKDAINTHFRSKYGTLASTWEALRGPLTKNGLAVIQVGVIENGQQKLKTILIHISGESIDSEMILINSKNDMQGLGSALSYARRYCLQSIAGIAAEDDDANQAVANHATTQTPVPGWSDSKTGGSDYKAIVAKPLINHAPLAPGEYVVPFGKYAGKTMADIGDELSGYMQYLKKMPSGDKGPSENFVRFLAEADKYLKTPSKPGAAKTPPADEWDPGPPPPFDDSEQLPF